MKYKYFSKYEVFWVIFFLILSFSWIALEIEVGAHKTLSSYIIYSCIYFVLSAVFYFLFFLDKKNNRFKRRMRFKHAFWSGFALTILICTACIPVHYVAHAFFIPDFLPMLRDFVIKNNLLQISEANLLFHQYNLFWFYPLCYFISGMIFTLIFAKFFRRVLNKRRR